jgi:DNA-binding transcriptional LysR family regulator
LTEVGDRYFKRCLSILADLAEADREAKQHSEAPQGLLPVSCSTLFSHRHFLSEYEDDRDVGIYAIFPSNRYLLPKVQCFVEFLVESCSDVV